MDASKIQLSGDEWQLVQNSDWILTKHAVIDKVYTMFGEIAATMQTELANDPAFPAELLKNAPKISKGEQYRRMPWVVLDYPRVFSKEHTMAIRHFFWWGHYFSSTLHVKGRFLEDCIEGIM
ncbi:MAG: hypothetical protein JST39_20575, partial [Bacteroidetes bacterium]|nr:hypothetical protein [Bacteroidota bacterium]